MSVVKHLPPRAFFEIWGKDKGIYEGKKEKGVEKFECHVTLSKSLKKSVLKNKMLHERKKEGWKMLILPPPILRNVNTIKRIVL